MNFHRIVLLHLFVFLLCGCCNALNAADKPPARAQRDAQELVNGVRLKMLTKDLELTVEQQGKVQGLLREEGIQIKKIREDQSASVTQKSTRIAEHKRETFSKIKPLLTVAQLEKFDKALNVKPKPPHEPHKHD